MRITFNFPHEVEGGEQCPGEGCEAEATWNRYIPASQWEPAEGGYFDIDAGPEVCPVCGHAYTPSEFKELDRTVIEQAAEEAQEMADYARTRKEDCS